MNDKQNLMYHSVVYLSQLHKYMTFEEQLDVVERLRENMNSLDMVYCMPIVDGFSVKPVNRYNQSEKSPFLYTPLGKTQMSAFFVEGEPLTFTLNLTNPFLIDLQLDKIELIYSNIELINTTISDHTVAKKTSKTILITCTPLGKGDLSIKAVKLCIFDLNFSYFISSKWEISQNKESKAIIPILPAQPLLKMNRSNIIGDSISLLNGEEFRVEYFFTNLSSFTIEKFDLSINIERSLEKTETFLEAASCIEFNKGDVKLPIKPREEFCVPLNVRGVQECKGATIKIIYGTKDSEIVRFVAFRLNITVYPSINISNSFYASEFLTLDIENEYSFGMKIVNPSAYIPPLASERFMWKISDVHKLGKLEWQTDERKGSIPFHVDANDAAELKLTTRMKLDSEEKEFTQTHQMECKIYDKLSISAQTHEDDHFVDCHLRKCNQLINGGFMQNGPNCSFKPVHVVDYVFTSGGTYELLFRILDRKNDKVRLHSNRLEIRVSNEKQVHCNK